MFLMKRLLASDDATFVRHPTKKNSIKKMFADYLIGAAWRVASKFKAQKASGVVQLYRAAAQWELYWSTNSVTWR